MGSPSHLWHASSIMFAESNAPITLRVVNALYVEAMVLADEARAYFDQAGHGDRDGMSPLARVTLSCESLKVTTRLMHAIAWLLSQRARIEQDTIGGVDAKLGTATPSDLNQIATLPAEAQRIIRATIDLHDRVSRLDDHIRNPMPVTSPARALQSRLFASA
jgi:regulator of CtrA degradation